MAEDVNEDVESGNKKTSHKIRASIPANVTVHRAVQNDRNSGYLLHVQGAEFFFSEAEADALARFFLYGE